MNARLSSLLLLVSLLAATGCASHSTDSTEVGVVTNKIGLFGKEGIQDQVYPPGGTYFFVPMTTDWHTFDVSLQTLAMVKDPKRGDRQHEDDLKFKTIDGNDVEVDVTVSWQIEAKKVPYLLAKVGESTREVKERLVRPTCRSVVRDVLNELSSEEFYLSEKRFEKANKARDELNKLLEPEGVEVRQVILGEHRFNPDYQQVIVEKKLAEQNTERLHSEARAADEQAKRNLEQAKGKVSKQIAEAQGQLDTVKLAADADYFKAQQQAQAILAEKKAEAKAIEKRNEALAGAGGASMVKLRIAEALAGKKIVFLPSSKGGMNLQTLNLNTLLKTAAASASVTPAVTETQDSQ